MRESGNLVLLAQINDNKEILLNSSEWHLKPFSNLDNCLQVISKTNHKLRYQIKEKKIQRNFICFLGTFFFSLPQWYFLEFSF